MEQIFWHTIALQASPPLTQSPLQSSTVSPFEFQDIAGGTNWSSSMTQVPQSCRSVEVIWEHSWDPELPRWTLSSLFSESSTSWLEPETWAETSSSSSVQFWTADVNELLHGEQFNVLLTPASMSKGYHADLMVHSCAPWCTHRVFRMEISICTSPVSTKRSAWKRPSRSKIEMCHSGPSNVFRMARKK